MKIKISLKNIWVDLSYKNIKNIYEINPKGIIRNKMTKDIIKGTVNAKGYRNVCLQTDEGQHTFRFHILVAHMFIPYDGREYVNHKNGNKLRNDIINLERMTHSENILHAYRTNLFKNKRYPKLNGDKLIDIDVIEHICELISKGYTYKEIVIKLNIDKCEYNRSLIKDIKRGVSWSYIFDKYNR